MLPVRNIVMHIAYDGTSYLGWQKTKEGASVEGALELVLEQVLQAKVALQAAGRTDAGVHAEEQVVNFYTSCPALDFRRLLISLNQLLPKDIAVTAVYEAAPTFHPTLDCLCKEYHYWMCITPYQLPIHRFCSWHMPKKLDLDAVRVAARHLEGIHNFSAFCNQKKNEPYEHYRREVKSIVLIEQPKKRLQFIVRGPHFLYKMVRNIVGTLIYVGLGKLQAAEIPSILSSQNRARAGLTAPAHGLTLFKIEY